MRLIDADALLEKWHGVWGGIEEFVDTIRGKIENAPTVELRRGIWRRPFISGTKILNPYCFCSECAQSVRPNKRTKYCPDCGAKMEMEETK